MGLARRLRRRTCAQMSFSIVAIATMPGIGRVRAALARELLAAALRDPRLRALDRLVRSLASPAASTSRGSASLLAACVHDVADRDQRSRAASCRRAARRRASGCPRSRAVSILSRSSSVMLVRSLLSAPARMKPVPQIGPEQPPTFFVMIMLIFSRNAPIELRSRSFQSCSTTRKPDRERDAEVGVAREGVELAEVLLVLERRGRDRSDRRLDVRQGDFLHFLLLLRSLSTPVDYAGVD